ncbi:MoeA, N-terminal and linker domain containing protein [Rhabdaerophilaceae bacterium]
MTGSLVALNEIMTPALAQLTPVDAKRVATHAALGMRLAADVLAPAAIPLQPIALRAGLAIAALDIAGASMQAPIVLRKAPQRVRAGQTLPSNCDAIIAPDAVSPVGDAWEIAEAVQPNAYVRLAGHDLRPAAVIATAGQTISAEIAMVAGLAGIVELPVHCPTVAMEGFSQPHAAWLQARLRALGATLNPSSHPDVLIRRALQQEPRLAVQPGETAWVFIESGIVVIEMADRFDSLVAGWCTLVLPVIARLLDAQMLSVPHQLSRKLSSSIGITDVVLFRTDNGEAIPLAVGDFPLSAISTADAFALIPAGSEGQAAGSMISLTLLERPYVARHPS